MSYVDLLQDQIRSRADQSEDLLNGVEKWGPNLIRSVVSHHISIILWPPFVKNKLADLLIELLHRVIAAARKALALLRDFAASLGSPDTLRKLAGDLGTLVGGEGAKLQQKIEPAQLQSTLDANWNDSSGASEIYEQNFSGQREAVGKIEQYAGGMKDTLRSMADTIEWFYGELAGTALSLLLAVLGFITAIVSLALIETIVTAVPAVLGAVGAQLGLLAAAIGIGMMALTLTQNISNAAESLPLDQLEWTKLGSV